MACVGIKVLFKDRLGGAEGTPHPIMLPLPWVSPPSPVKLRMAFQMPNLPSRPFLWPLRGRKDVSLPIGDSQNSAVI